MCDGYAPFAMAFVGNGIDTTGYEVATEAVRNAPEVVITGQTGPKRRKTLSERLMARIRRLKAV